MTSRARLQPPSLPVLALVERIGPVVLGDRLRRLRTGMGLSIREVAGLAGLSKTSLVRLEQGERCRSATISRVCEVLGVHLERLADGPTDAVGMVHRASDERWVDMMDVAARALPSPPRGRSRRTGTAAPVAVAVNLLRSRLTNGRVLPTILEVRAESAPRSHPGEEFVYVLAGKLRLTVGSSVFTLAAGDSITFWSGELHSYAPAGRAPTRVLSVRVDG